MNPKTPTTAQMRLMLSGRKPVKLADGGQAKGGFVNDNHREWFGDSKVVDENGGPLTVYHGTSKDTDFGKFKIPKNGAWFTDDKYTASAYAEENDSRGLKTDDGRNYREVNTASRVMPVHLRIEKPYTPTYDEMTALIRASNYKREQGKLFEKARAMGHDGIDMGNGVWVAIGHPTQVKSALGNLGTFDPKNPDINKAKGGEVKTPSLDAMKLALNNQRMYSPLEKAAMAVPRTKGTPAEFMAEVSKQPGFRKDEVEDRRISLPEQKMTKEEFLGHLKNHPAPLLNERVLGGDDFYEQANNMADSAYGESYDDLGLREQGLIDYDLEKDYGYNPKPQYEDWALPGGDNYREVLLTLPKKGLTDRERDQMMWIEANARRGEISAKDAAQLEALKRKQQQGAQDYQSSHWQDHPNVLAHMRLSDRRGPNGEKILHVDEVQSDWHQQGRKEGYKTQEDNDREARRKELGEKIRRGEATTSEMDESDALMRAANQSSRMAVPDAPFKKNWHELALKHVLGEAARGGYHGIAITPGDVQADRYDLSKQIEQIKYIQNSDGTYDMSVRPKGERRDTMFIGDKSLSGLSEQELEGIVGKEVAQKMVSGEGPQGGDNYRSLSGLDLQVGGEGMRGFYDKILPTFLNKLGKPHGAQVGTINVQGDPKKRPEIMQQMGVDPIRFGLMPRDHQQRISQQADALNQQPLHYFPITDSLRQQVKTEGLPQYERGGNVHPLIPDFED